MPRILNRKFSRTDERLQEPRNSNPPPRRRVSTRVPQNTASGSVNILISRKASCLAIVYSNLTGCSQICFHLAVGLNSREAQPRQLSVVLKVVTPLSNRRLVLKRVSVFMNLNVVFVRNQHDGFLGSPGEYESCDGCASTRTDLENRRRRAVYVEVRGNGLRGNRKEILVRTTATSISVSYSIYNLNEIRYKLPILFSCPSSSASIVRIKLPN